MMDVGRSPGSPTNPSFFSTGGVKIEVQEEEDNNHSSNQMNKLTSTPNSSFPPKPTVAVVEEKSEKSQEKKSAKLWTYENEILLLKAMAHQVKTVGHYKSKDFYLYIQSEIFSGNISLEQIASKFKHTRERYQAQKEKRMKGEASTFNTPHLPHGEEFYELSKPIWGSGGGGGDEAVGLLIPESNKRKVECNKPGKEQGEGEDGAAEEPEEEVVQVGETIERNKKTKANDGAAEEPEEAVVQVGETIERNKKKKKKKRNDGAAEELEVNGVAGETIDRNKKKKKKKRNDGAAVVQVNAVAGKQKEVVEAGETKKTNKKKKKKGTEAVETSEKKKKKTRAVEIEAVETKEKNNKNKRKAGAGDEKLKPSTDNQKPGEHGEEEISKKKKKKIKISNADSVSEKLIKQLAKSSMSFRVFLDEEPEETEKAIRLIEPSIAAWFTQEVKNFEEEKSLMLLRDTDLVHKLAGVLRETEPWKVVSITQESKNFEVEVMDMRWKEAALVNKLGEILDAVRSPTS